MSKPALLKVRDLQLDYHGQDGSVVRALDGVDLTVKPGEIVGIVGESGSGKSTLGLATGRLLPRNLHRAGGDLLICDQSVFAAGRARLRALRRDVLGFVFQNPMLSLDPTRTIGAQLALASPPATSRAALHEALAGVGLRDPERVARSHPHELSGGMAQRAVIAMAMARRPALLIADEPTASLDATMRDLVLDTMVRLCRDAGASMLLLSHELRVVARTCDRVAVMYGGRIVEEGLASRVLAAPSHPYTRALMGAAPGGERPGQVLRPIPGMPPLMTGPGQGCAFADRCAQVLPVCAGRRPSPTEQKGHLVACHLTGRAAA